MCLGILNGPPTPSKVWDVFPPPPAGTYTRVINDRRLVEVNFRLSSFKSLVSARFGDNECVDFVGLRNSCTFYINDAKHYMGSIFVEGYSYTFPFNLLHNSHWTEIMKVSDKRFYTSSIEQHDSPISHGKYVQ